LRVPLLFSTHGRHLAILQVVRHFVLSLTGKWRENQASQIEGGIFMLHHANTAQFFLFGTKSKRNKELLCSVRLN
jgi:hypothetical protein